MLRKRLLQDWNFRQKFWFVVVTEWRLELGTKLEVPPNCTSPRSRSSPSKKDVLVRTAACLSLCQQPRGNENMSF